MRRCLELEKTFNQQEVIKVSRWTLQECFKMHVFVDASQRAAGPAVYVRRSNITASKPQLIYGNTRLVLKRESRNQLASIARLLAVTTGVGVLELLNKKSMRKKYIYGRVALVSCTG
uniref:Polyprotein n=1 Tax=Loa loa TaxID=7209 RepID=A0A1I7V666_LOALO